MATQHTTVRALQGDTVDAICWRHYGATLGKTEAVLAANPGLAAHGPVLPQGLAVRLPQAAPAPQKTTIKLWD